MAASKRRHASRQIERAAVDQRIDQRRPPRDGIRQRRGKRQAVGQQLQQAGPRFEQAEQIDRAAHAAEQAFPPGNCALRIGRSGKRID